MQLDATVTVGRPHVGQGPAEFSVPHQGWQILDDDGHANVVYRTVGRHRDHPSSHLAPPKQPHIPCPCQIKGLIEGDAHSGHGRSLGRCVGGRYLVWQPSLVSPPPVWSSCGPNGGAELTRRRRYASGCTPGWRKPLRPTKRPGKADAMTTEDRPPLGTGKLCYMAEDSGGEPA